MRVYRRRRNRRHQELSVLEKRYIGDPAVIEEKIDSVANQGKAK